MAETTDDAAQATGLERRVADLLGVLDASRKFAECAELRPLLDQVEQSSARLLGCARVRVVLRDGEEATAEESDSRGVLSCPAVGWDDSPVGVLRALDKRGGSFGSWDEVLAGALAAQAGAAIQRLLREGESSRGRPHPVLLLDHDVARQIQQALLPKWTPAIPGFDIAGWNQPADATGGDFFDFQELPGGRLGVTVADVSGHGVGAALVVAECRAFLRATLIQTEDPGRVLAQVNRLLCEGQPRDRFVTAFFGLLDAGKQRLTYVSAGHGPLWFYSRASGTFLELEVQGYPLALQAEGAFTPAGMVEFAPGDLLAIVTDGFFEWIDARGQCFGIERLRDRIRRDRDLTAAEIIHNLHREVLAFAEEIPQPDDLTAVVIKRLA